jgi:hypothetical protein
MSSKMWETCDAHHEDQDNGKRFSAYACINPLDDTITWFRCSQSSIEKFMRHFLQQLLIIVDPLLKSHNLRVSLFEELLHEGRHHGMNYMLQKERILKKNGKSAELCIKIRLLKGPNTWHMYPLGELLDIFCHELAHCWHREHGDCFLRKWVELRSELEKDLGGILKVYMRDRQYADRIKTLIKADRGLPPGKLPFIPEYTRQPNTTSIEAVERWEKKFRTMLQHAETLDAKK